jgi:hypothetical protein
MSHQYSDTDDPDTDIGTSSPMAASILSGFRQPPQSLFLSVQGLVERLI